jgi:hypothetical protein
MKGIINLDRASTAQATGQRMRNDACFGNSIQSLDVLNQVSICFHYARVIISNEVATQFIFKLCRNRPHPSGQTAFARLQKY